LLFTKYYQGNELRNVYKILENLTGNNCFEDGRITLIWVLMKSWVAQSVHCLTTDWMAGVRSPTEAEDFSCNLCIQTSSGAHPASYTMGMGGFP
jgi:hypothetical protein